MKKILPILILICFCSTSIFASENIKSTLFNTNLSIENAEKATTDMRPKYRIGFDAPQINHRQLLLTIDENCTDGVDWGYEGETPLVLADDMYWLISNKEYVIQGMDTLFIGKEIPLGVVTTNGGAITIKIDALENPISTLKVGLKDTALNVIHKLEESDYQVTLDAGVYHNRFLIVFLSADDTELPTSEDDVTEETPDPVEDEASSPFPPPPGFTDTETEEEVVDEEIINTEEEEATEEGEEEDAATEEGEEEAAEETNDTADEVNEEDEDENGEENEAEDAETSTGNDNNNTNQNYLNKNKLIIYVNNGQNILNVKNKRGIKIRRVTLLNRNGQRVNIWSDNLDNKILQFQLQVPKGVYLVMVHTNNDRIVKRVLIQNS